ncbi:MAG: hypothetical protein JO007_18935 [Alphaproteobacteria bacterium]|nr:hypothetical protein [Alphaproteobacteria bacterium]
MALMLSKTYHALLSAGASEEEAQAAAEELADYESRITSIDTRLGRIEGRLESLEREVTSRFTPLTWAVGINAAATIAILGTLLHGRWF